MPVKAGLAADVADDHAFARTGVHDNVAEHRLNTGRNAAQGNGNGNGQFLVGRAHVGYFVRQGGCLPGQMVFNRIPRF
jgi:hypothetical protein